MNELIRSKLMELRNKSNKKKFDSQYNYEFIEIQPDMVEIKYKMDGETMVEGQSRYGIMEELNTKKLKEKENLDKLESEKEQGIRGLQEKIDTLKKVIESVTATYKTEHKQWKINKEVELKTLEAYHKKKVDIIKDQIKDRDESYEQDFKNWKENQQQSVVKLEKELNLFEKDKESDIRSKKEIIEEIEKGIKNLKEMSKEQSTK